MGEDKLKDALQLYRRLDSKIIERAIRLEKHLEHLEDHILEIKRQLEDISKTINSMKETIESIRSDLAYEARRRVEEVLSSKYPGIELQEIFLSSGVRFDVFGRIGDLVIIGRAYSVAGLREYEKLLADIERLETVEPSLSSPNKLIVIYALRPLKELIEKALTTRSLLIVTPTRLYGRL